MLQRTLEQPGHVFPGNMPAFSNALPTPPYADTQPPSGADADQDKNGMIIVQNDKIFITPPLPGGKPAVISALHPVVLKINRIKVTDPTRVNPSDQLSWQISEKPQFQITVSEDKLKTYFTLYRVEKYAWKLVNCPASAEVTVRAEPDYDLLLSKLTVDQILAGFPKSSFMPNLNIPALYAELNNPTYLPVCIASGKPPLPGISGHLELLIQPDMEGEFSLEGAPASSEYLDYPGITSIRAGEVIARKLPPQEGAPGFDVYGGILPAPQPEDITIAASREVSLQRDGEIVALHDGRPRITGWGTSKMSVDFPAAYVMPADSAADEQTLTFAGDVIAPAGVSDYCTIEALGNVYIYGDVRHAVIAASGSIVIRGTVTDSHLYSGYYGAVQHRMYQFPDHLIEEMDALRTAACLLEKNLLSRQQSVKFGLVVMLLLESKYVHIPGLISGLQQLLAGQEAFATKDTEQLRHMLEVFLHPGQFTEFITDTVLGSFLKLLEELRDRIAGMHEGQTRIDTGQAEDCIIHTGGDLYIHGKSVKNSTLRATGNVQFVMDQSSCSGSTVEAGGFISVPQVDAASARQSVLTAGSRILVNQISDTRVSIGEYTAEIGDPAGESEFTVQSLRMRNQN